MQLLRGDDHEREEQNSCLVLNLHFARRTGTLHVGTPTSSGAAARASSVCQKRMSFSAIAYPNWRANARLLAALFHGSAHGS